MDFAWKFMLPMTLLNIFAAGVWHFMPARHHCAGSSVRVLVVCPVRSA